MNQQIQLNDRKTPEKKPFILSGILLLICGTLLFFTPRICGILFAVNPGTDITTVTASSIISSVFQFDNILHMMVSVISVITGIALLQNRSGRKSLLITASVFLLLSACCSALMLFAAKSSPLALISVYTSDDEVIRTCLDMIVNHPGVLIKYTVLGLPTLIVSIVNLAIACAHKAEPDGKTDKAVLSVLIVSPLLMLVTSVTDTLSLSFAGRYGVEAVSASSIARGSASSLLPIVCMIILICAAITASAKMRMAPPIICGVLLIYVLIHVPGIIVYHRLNAMNMNIPNIDHALLMYIIRYFILALACIAVTAAAVRGSLPVWLSIVMPLAVVPVFIIAELVKAAIVIPFYIPLGTFIISAVMIAVSALMHTIKAKQN